MIPMGIYRTSTILLYPCFLFKSRVARYTDAWGRYVTKDVWPQDHNSPASLTRTELAGLQAVVHIDSNIDIKFVRIG